MSEAAAPSVMILPEMLDLKAATPLTASLLEARGFALSLDASRVQRLGGQCLQVLLSAQATWRADGLSLEFVNQSAEFAESLKLLGANLDNFSDQDN